MNTVASIALSCLTGSTAAVLVVLALHPGDASTDALTIGQLENSLQEVEAANASLATRLDELARQKAVAVPASANRSEAPIVSADDIAAAVAAYMKNHAGAPMDGAAGAGGEADAVAFDIKTDLEGLLGKSFFQDPDAWKRAFEAGKMDEVIAEIEALAEANPNDPQSQMNLASAYMAYLQMDNTKWDMSMKADGQFDKVLALDENHWEARFTKAVSYTFWPSFLGKGKDAISHFETLVKQQESMPPQDHEAQTYLYLGNMLAEKDPARAREMWQKGMTRHPSSEELRAKLNN